MGGGGEKRPIIMELESVDESLSAPDVERHLSNTSNHLRKIT